MITLQKLNNVVNESIKTLFAKFIQLKIQIRTQISKLKNMIKKLKTTENSVIYYKNVKNIYENKNRDINKVKLNLKIEVLLLQEKIITKKNNNFLLQSKTAKLKRKVKSIKKILNISRFETSFVIFSTI